MPLPSFMTKAFTCSCYPQVMDHGTATIDYTATPATAMFGSTVLASRERAR